MAKRLHVDPSRIVKIETSEIQGGITLRTMKSVAESIDCQFIYCFIPNTSLEELVTSQAKKVATAEINRSSHNMDLEAQSVEIDILRVINDMDSRKTSRSLLIPAS